MSSLFARLRFMILAPVCLFIHTSDGHLDLRRHPSHDSPPTLQAARQRWADESTPPRAESYEACPEQKTSRDHVLPVRYVMQGGKG